MLRICFECKLSANMAACPLKKVKNPVNLVVRSKEMPFKKAAIVSLLLNFITLIAY